MLKIKYIVLTICFDDGETTDTAQEIVWLRMVNHSQITPMLYFYGGKLL